jgi:aminopeptidase N
MAAAYREHRFGREVYTTTYLGRSVATDDFRRAMEEATGRDLGAFFTEWVYAAR